jgi:hypothetical protein
MAQDVPLLSSSEPDAIEEQSPNTVGNSKSEWGIKLTEVGGCIKIDVFHRLSVTGDKKHGYVRTWKGSIA